MSGGACGWSESLHRDPAALGYDQGSQTAQCPGCSQRVQAQVVLGRKGRVDAIKLGSHDKA